MAKVCAGCGAASGESEAFCRSCGRALGGSPAAGQAGGQAGGQGQLGGQPGYGAPPVGYAPPQPGYPPPQQGYAPPVAPGYGAAVAPAKSGSGSAIKWVVGILGVLGVFAVLAVAGVWYVAHKVKQKIVAESGAVQTALSQAQAESNAANADVPRGTGEPVAQEAVGGGAALTGNLCRLLSVEEVSAAIGVTVTEAVAPAGADGCFYYAMGNPKEMWAKHVAASPKVDAAEAAKEKSEEEASVIGAMAHDEQGEARLIAGKAVVFSFSIDADATQMKMDLMRKAVESKIAVEDVAGVGDSAFEGGHLTLFVRKGNQLARIGFATCPCAMDAVLPLARKLAGQM